MHVSVRSQDLRLEEGANPVSGHFQGGLQSGVEIKKLAQSCNHFLAKCFLLLKKIHDPQRPYGYWVFLISCVMIISVDPVFFYVPTIAAERKCLGFDGELRITAIALHSISAIVYLTYVNYLLPTASPKIEVKHFWHFSLIDLLVVLPLPLVLLILIIDIPELGVQNFMFPMNFFLLQYLLRVTRCYTLFTKATRVSGILAEAKWAKAAFNFLLYLNGGHVFGALWYFSAVAREMICWEHACSVSTTGCSRRSFYCSHENSIDNQWFFSVNDLCRDDLAFDFGIFKEAIQHQIVDVTSFVGKFPYCLRWGLQSLSSFGQSLQPSASPGENIFVISIITYSMVLFVLFIGNMEMYLQSVTIKSENVRLKEREIEQWMSSRQLSEKFQMEFKKYQPYKWQEIPRIDVASNLLNLPKDLKRNIKRELCLEQIKQVQELKKFNEATLDSLCECLKLAYYNERSYIGREGNPVDEMLFVVQGKLRVYTSVSTVRTGSQRTGHRDHKNHHLKGGDFCGEELVAWFQADPYSSNFPVSTRTIQALTDVEAFVLMADDLQNLFIKQHSVHFLQSYWRFRRIW
ncbi:hypothetical protein CICLE_v10006626mg, partial [Citrus x clementina]